MSFIAVNVCLVCNAFEAAAVPLSLSMCPAPEEETLWDDAVSYRLVSLAEKKLQRGYGHAHCTVAQLCVRAAELSDLKDAVKVVWQKHRDKAVESKEKLTLTKIEAGPVFGQTTSGVDIHLPSIAVQRSDALVALHSDVVEGVKQFCVQLQAMDVAKSTFHKTFPSEGTTSVQWLMDFLDKYAGENYAPHITLGASPVDKIDSLTFFQESKVQWRECRLVVSHMGNYCSCFELLE